MFDIFHRIIPAQMRTNDQDDIMARLERLVELDRAAILDNTDVIDRPLENA